MGVKRGLEGLIAGAVKAELDRLVGRVADPIHAKVDEAITQAARRAAAPLQARLERAVGDAVELDFRVIPRGGSSSRS